MKNAVVVPDEILELKAMLEPAWPQMRPSGLVCEAQPGTAPAAQGDGGEGGGDPGAGDGAAAAQPTADPRVLEQMQQQMEQFGGVIGQVAEYLPALEQMAGQQGGAAVPGQQGNGSLPSFDDLATGFADLYGGGETDAYGNPVAPDPQQARQLVEQFRDVVRAEIAPLQQGFQTLQGTETSRQLSALSQELPALQDETTANAVAERAVQAAELFLGPGASEEDVRRASMNPQLVRMAAHAHIYEQRARDESPAGGSGLDPIEGGGGASPGTPAGDPGDAIVAAGRTGGEGAGAHFRT